MSLFHSKKESEISLSGIVAVVFVFSTMICASYIILLAQKIETKTLLMLIGPAYMLALVVVVIAYFLLKKYVIKFRIERSDSSNGFMFSSGVSTKREFFE